MTYHLFRTTSRCCTTPWRAWSGRRCRSPRAASRKWRPSCDHRACAAAPCECLPTAGSATCRPSASDRTWTGWNSLNWDPPAAANSVGCGQRALPGRGSARAGTSRPAPRKPSTAKRSATPAEEKVRQESWKPGWSGAKLCFPIVRSVPD